MCVEVTFRDRESHFKMGAHNTDEHPGYGLVQCDDYI